MPKSESQRRAEARYKEKHYDLISIRVPKGIKDDWKEKAALRDMSLIRLITDGVEEYIQSHPVKEGK